MPLEPGSPPSVGILAVQAGLITQQQLMECIHLQGGEEKPLEAIIIEKGFATRDQLAAIVKLYDSAVRKDPKQGVTTDRPATRVRDRQTATRIRPAETAPAEPPGRASSGRIPAPALGSTPQRGTSVRMKSGSSTRMPAPSRGTGVRTKTAVRDNTKVRKEKRWAKIWLLGGLLALVPLALLGGLMVFDSKRPPPVLSGPPIELPAPPIEPPKKLESRTQLPHIMERDPLAGRWNEIVDHVNGARSADGYPSAVEQIEKLIRDAKGSKFEELFRKGHADLIRCINVRADEVYRFLADDVKRLCEAGKYGLAVQTWDWFPGILDIGHIYEKKIESDKQNTLAAGKKFYGDLKTKADGFFAGKKYEDAKLAMLQALEIGLKELADDAYKQINLITEAEDAAARKREEEDLKTFEELAKAEREAGQLIAALRGQFWQLVSERRFDTADVLIRKEKERGGDVGKDALLLAGVLKDIRAGFDVVAKALKAHVGETISLSILKGGKPSVRTIRLKDLSKGRIVFSVEGKDLDEAVTDLDASEFEKVAGTLAGEAQSWLKGIAALLADDFDRAHGEFGVAGDKGAALRAFIESSTAFLQKNAKHYKERAKAAMEAKEYERAVVEYSRLCSLPKERQQALRGRARAYYQLGNFVACVLDIEQLVLLDDLADEVLDLLAQTYERSSLIVKAIDIYEKARARKPKHAGVQAALMQLYMQIHEYAKARQVLTEATAVSPQMLGLKHLLDIAEASAFPGESFKAPWGRYDVMTNVSQEYAKEMAFFMDGVYKEYVKVFPYKKNETLRFHVKIFASEGEFQNYYTRVTGQPASGAYGKILAYYMPVTKELVGWNAKDIKETLQHEGLHQYIDYFVQNCPIWFNEGFASYFEKSTAEKAIFNENRHRTCKSAMSMKMLPSLKGLLMMSQAEWQRDEKAVFYYGHAWSFIYYLIKNGQKSLLDKYFEEVMAGKTQQQAFDAIFGPGKANLSELESKWRKAVFSDDYEPK